MWILSCKHAHLFEIIHHLHLSRYELFNSYYMYVHIVITNELHLNNFPLFPFSFLIDVRYLLYLLMFKFNEGGYQIEIIIIILFFIFMDFLFYMFCIYVTQRSLRDIATLLSLIVHICYRPRRKAWDMYSSANAYFFFRLLNVNFRLTLIFRPWIEIAIENQSDV